MVESRNLYANLKEFRFNGRLISILPLYTSIYGPMEIAMTTGRRKKLQVESLNVLWHLDQLLGRQLKQEKMGVIG